MEVAPEEPPAGGFLRQTQTVKPDDVQRAEVRVSILEADMRDALRDLAVEPNGRSGQGVVAEPASRAEGAAAVRPEPKTRPEPNPNREEEAGDEVEEEEGEGEASRAIVEVVPEPENGANWLGGQDGVIHQAEELLRGGVPLLGMCGGPGHGKSTAAQAVASRLTCAGVWASSAGPKPTVVVSLRMVEDPDHVPGHVGVSVGAISSSQRRRGRFTVEELAAYVKRYYGSSAGAAGAEPGPTSEAARPSEERLGIVLDDVDHLILGEERRTQFHGILQAVLDAAPDRVQMLLTSQQPMRVPEHEIPCMLVPLLSTSSALSVLRSLTPALDSHAAEAMQLAAKSGGVPATIYAISCAICNGMPPAELLEQIQRNGNIHSVSQEAYGGGHHLHSLSDASNYSLGTLVREYRDALVLLSIFPDQFDIDGAAAVLGARTKVMVTGLMKVLTQAHMVLPAGTGFYYLHPLIRDVLTSDAQRFESQGRYEEARCRFIQHFGDLFCRVGQAYRNHARSSGAHHEFQQHRGSINLMMSWVGTRKQPEGSGILYCRLLWSSWDLLQLLMSISELETFTRQCVAMAQDTGDQLAEGRALVMDAFALIRSGRFQVALDELDVAREILMGIGDNKDRATEAAARGMALASRGSYIEAKDALNVAIGLRAAVFGDAHPETAEVFCEMAQILTELAVYDKAATLHTKALKARSDALGDDHPAVAMSQLCIGQLQQIRGEVAEAEANLRRVIEVCKPLYGSEHEMVAAALLSLAKIRAAEGYTSEARLLAISSKEIFEKTVGAKHPRVSEPLLVITQLGLSRGSAHEVEESLMKAVEFSHQHMRSDHPRVLAALNALGAFKRVQGNYEDAAVLHASVSKHIKGSPALGPEHPLMAATLCLMGSVREAQGNLSAALTMLIRAEEILEAAFRDAKNQAFVTVWSGIASVTRAQGNIQQAEMYYNKILSLSGMLEGGDGNGAPGCAGFFAPVAFNNLGLIYKARGGLRQAEYMFRQSLALTERSYGQEHVSVAKSLNNLAQLLMDKAQYADAEELYRRAGSVISKKLGPNHIEMATSLNGLAVVMKKMGKLADAEKLYHGTLEIQQNAVSNSAKSPCLAVTYTNLGSLQQSQGQFEAAESSYREALKIRTACFGEAHAAVATSLANLASLMNDTGRYQEAEGLYNRSLWIREQVLGKDHTDVAQSLMGLAQLFRNTGQKRSSLEHHRRALALLEAALGPEHLKVAESCEGLAAILADIEANEVTNLHEQVSPRKTKGGVGHRFKKALSLRRTRSDISGKPRPAEVEVQEAEELYRRAIGIRNKCLGVAHPDMASALNGLALILKRKKSYKESERIYRMAVNISERNHGVWHPSVGTSMHELAELLDRQEMYEEAEPFYRRSIDVWEKTLGPLHPHLLVGLGNLARLLYMLGREAEAEEVENKAEKVTEERLMRNSNALAMPWSCSANTEERQLVVADAPAV